MKYLRHYKEFLLILILVSLLFSVGSFVVPKLVHWLIPPWVVNYYGEILTSEELDAKTDTTYCGFIPLNPLESLVQSYSYKPIAMCFDTEQEVLQFAATR